MIYTITLNPSVDYIVHVKDFSLGELNKMEFSSKFPGGKGINVSRVLQELGSDSTALGFIGGFPGEFIKEWLNRDGINTDFIEIQDDTRINIKLKSDLETEINDAGPQVTKDEAKRLISQLDRLKENDVVILSGSKPPALPDDFYLTLVQKITSLKAKFVIDTTSQELEKILPYQPLLVKPNKEELEQFFKIKLNRIDDILIYGKKLQQLGAENVIVSMGGEGAVLITEDAIYQGFSPKGKLINSVGAGDSMVAGFISTYLTTKEVVASFKMGIAAGSATAFSDDLAGKKDILDLLEYVSIKEIFRSNS